MTAYGWFAQVYDRLMADMPYGEWVSFAEACFERYGSPATIADLGCGTGSITIPLARKGRQVYGIDLSGEMLTMARDKEEALRSSGAPGNEGNLLWLQQDMREWELPGQVDAVVSFCDCISYLTEESDLKKLFRQTYEGLRPGGLFVFDVHAPAQMYAYADNQPYTWNEDDLAYIWTCDFQEEWLQIEHELTFFFREEGQDSFRRFEETHVQRAYPLDLITYLLGEAGFETLGCFGDFTWEDADEKTERAFYIAKKKE